jgi:hypothetical protein
MNDLSPETRRLLDMARDGDRLPPGRRALLESKFFTRVAGGALVGLAAREAWAKSAGLFGPITKGVAGLAIVSSIGAGGYFAVRASRYDAAPKPARAAMEAPRETPPVVWSPPATQAITAPARPRVADPSENARRSIEPREPVARRAVPLAAPPAPVRSRTAGSTPRSAPAPVAAAPAQASQPSAPAASPPPAPENTVTPPPAEEAPPPRIANNTLNDETRILWEADQALRSGNTSRAVSLLDEHASKYPDGALSPERGAERVVALCKLGRIDAPTIRSYLSSHPNLSLSERIQQACSRILSRTK